MTTQDSAANPFDYWREMFQKSTEAWAQAAGPAGNASWPSFFGAAPGGSMPGFGQMPGFNAASGFNPFSQFTPPVFTNDIQTDVAAVLQLVVGAGAEDGFGSSGGGGLAERPEAVDGATGSHGQDLRRSDGHRELR